MCRERRHAFIRAALGPRSSRRRGDADQVEVRGGWSGGGWPTLWGQESFRSDAIRAETADNGWKIATGIPAKHFVTQAAMNTHLSQSIGAFVGQHGMSPAISSAVAA